MSKQIAVRIPKGELEEIDAIVAAGSFANRAAAVREGLRLLIRSERDRRIGEEYRRAYEAQPQTEWFGEASAAALGEELAARKRDRRR